MADPVEQITYHLTAHGVPFEIGIRSTVLEDVLASMDYAMVLGMIGPRNAGLLLAKYTGDRQEERKCRAWWLMDCIETAAAKGWKRPRGRMIEGMAYLTMDEHMGHGTRCAVCNGTKERVFDNRKVTCPGCEGRGFNQYDDALFQESMGCSEQEWRSGRWTDRILWARRALHCWEVDARVALANKLGAY